MLNGGYVGLSGQIALVGQLETIANNLANISTVGFRSDQVRFSSILFEANSDSVAFSTLGQPAINRKAGSLKNTGNPLDLAVKGDSWLSVMTPVGRVYTRDGRLNLDATGSLVTVTGFAVLDAGGAPLRIDPLGPPPIISRDGTISQGGQIAGTVGLFNLPPGSRLTRGPASSIVSSIPGAPVLDFTTHGLVQGFVEDSNVNPLEQITKLIAVQRMFEMVSGSLDTMNSAQLDAIKAMGSTA